MMGEWPKNLPDSLQDSCLEYIALNIHKFLTKDSQGLWTFKPGIAFTSDLSDKLIQCLVNNTKHLHDEDDNVFSIFRDTGCTNLTQLNLPYTCVTSHHLEYLCASPLREIDISFCEKADSTIMIQKAAKTLCLLRLTADNFHCIEDNIYDRGDCNGHKNVYRDSNRTFTNLRSLSVRETDLSNFDRDKSTMLPFLERLLSPSESLVLTDLHLQLPRLTHLDLCGCTLSRHQSVSLGDLRLPCLVSLSLCDVLKGSAAALDNLSKFTKLRHLDVSQGDNNRIFIPVQYSNPTHHFLNLLTSMPDLVSLDISGTNLAGIKPIFPVEHRLKPQTTDVDNNESPGIEGLNGRKFEFLGLLDCADEASHRGNLPSNLVTGDANEEQVIASVQVYRDKPSLLTRAFNYLFNLFRYSTVKAQSAAIEGILTGMSHHKHDRHVQISGSASLFYIVKGDQRHNISFRQKKRMIDCVLEAMERHLREITMMRNGCLTLCHFNIPSDVMFCYNRLVKVLLAMLREEFEDDFIQRIGIFLLNSLACQVEGHQKQALGDRGTIEVMCIIIRHRLDRKECDEILEVAWSTLWNVTDETASNCKRFMDEDGMYLFLDCMKEFPDKEELLRNMMGLMGNIAEVKELRPVLMNSDYVTVFSDFLESTKDGIEVSYNAAGVLAHMLSDGVDSWTVSEPSRDEVSARMSRAIERWPLTSKRNINYRSFLPILRLVQCFESESAQHWAVWALCNLTQVYPEKYCKLLQDEGGMAVLNALVHLSTVSSQVRTLSKQVHDFVTKQPCKQPDTDDEEMEEVYI